MKYLIWLERGLFYASFGFITIMGLLALYVYMFRFYQACRRSPGIVKDNVTYYLLFLGSEIPAILTILAFSSLIIIFTKSALSSVTSWLLFIYLQIKAGEEMYYSKKLVNKEEEEVVQWIWFAFAAISTLIFNVIILLMSIKLIQIAQIHS